MPYKTISQSAVVADPRIGRSDSDTTVPSQKLYATFAILNGIQGGRQRPTTGLLGGPALGSYLRSIFTSQGRTAPDAPLSVQRWPAVSLAAPHFSAVAQAKAHSEVSRYPAVRERARKTEVFKTIKKKARSRGDTGKRRLRVAKNWDRGRTIVPESIMYHVENKKHSLEPSDPS